MLDPIMQKYVDDRIKRGVEAALKKRDMENAAGIVFDKYSGRHTDGKNVIGSFGNRVAHHSIRTKPTEQTIDTGKIQYSSSDIAIFTESAAGSDDLDTINPNTLAYGNELLIIRAADDGDTVVVKDGTGNITCDGDFSMDSIDDCMVLRWDVTNELWIEVARHDSTNTEWASYTPTWTTSGGGNSIGNGTLSGEYTRIGNTIHARVYWTAGSTTVMGTGDFRFGLPAAASNLSGKTFFPVGNSGRFSDATSGNNYPLEVSLTTSGGGYVILSVSNTTGTYAVRGTLKHNVPVTVAQNDFIEFHFTYTAT